MGFEIKNICTVVPNPHHPMYKENEGSTYYYFSIFITPRLQFDGTLKEFYEMLNWPDYIEQIFWNNKAVLQHINLISNYNHSPGLNLERDFFYTKKVYSQLSGLDNIENFDENFQGRFLMRGKEIWKKLFLESTPVVAWPINIGPQFRHALDQESDTDGIGNTFEEGKNEKLKDSVQNPSATSNSTAASQLSISRARPLIGDNIGKEYVGFESTSLFSGHINPSERHSTSDREGETDSTKKANETEKANESKKYSQEFHVKISALSRYPHILRLLGLIHDFKISRENFKDLFKNEKEIFVKLNFDIGKIEEGKAEPILREFKKSVQFVTPYTRCDITKIKRTRVLRAHFLSSIDDYDQTVYKKEYPDPKDIPNYDDYIRNGFLNKEKYRINQKYLEDEPSSFLDSEDLAKQKVNNNDLDQQKDSNLVGIDSNFFEDEDIKILRSKATSKQKVSKGFSIKIMGQPKDLLTNIDSKLLQLKDENIEDIKSAFMAHHLDCGYRVDVLKVPQGNWENPKFLSLCERTATYMVDGKKGNHPTIEAVVPDEIIEWVYSKKLFDNFKDEPWLEEVRQVDNEGTEKRFEEIARWNGWSLTCPPLNAENSIEDYEADDLELKNIKPSNLPKLRFGDYQYWFRIRIVDICGNGISLSSENIEKGKVISDDITYYSKTYKRLERIASPLFFPPYELLKNKTSDNPKISPKIVERYKGEDNQTFVIRTNVNEQGSPNSFDDSCLRFITPQYISANFAELSGYYEEMTENNKTSDKKNLYELLKKVPKDSYSMKDFEDGIPFAVDKEVSAFEILGENINYCIAIDTINQLKKKPCSLVLDKEGLKHRNKLIGPLAIGDSKQLEIFSVSNSFPKSESKTFSIIHAVQRPVLLNKRLEYAKNNNENPLNFGSAIYFKKRLPLPVPGNQLEDAIKYQVEVCLLNMNEIGFPFSTSGEIVVLAEYWDIQLNPKNNLGWSYISDKKSSKKEEGTNDTNFAKKFILRKSWSNLNESTTHDRLDTILSDSNTQSIKDEYFNFFRHQFPDTKYRKVNYKLEAISKYSEFFDKNEHNIGDVKNPFSLIGNLDNQIEKGTTFTIIKNSAKPSKPTITSIIPIFRQYESKENGESTYEFKHDTFRMYLGETWFETGLDEKLAVIFKDVNEINASEDNKGLISIIANDPTTDSDNKNYEDNSSNYVGRLRGDYLFDTRLLDVTIDSIIDTKIEDNKYPITINSNDRFKPLEVKWDKSVLQFYSDIRFDNIHNYSTLFKFSVCRYQEQSIVLEGYYDYRFSDAVNTDMVSALPTRTVSILEDHIKYDLNGQIGGRYRMNNSKDETTNPTERILVANKVYLICEKDNLSDYVSKIEEHKQGVNNKILISSSFEYAVNVPLISIGPTIQYYGANGNLAEISYKQIENSYKSIFVEEYEDIALNDDFRMNETAEDYNPRNDPRKRLIFFYKIK